MRQGPGVTKRNLLDELVRARDAEVFEDLPPDTYALVQDLLPDVIGAHH